MGRVENRSSAASAPDATRAHELAPATELTTSSIPREHSAEQVLPAICREHWLIDKAKFFRSALPELLTRYKWEGSIIGAGTPFSFYRLEAKGSLLVGNGSRTVRPMVHCFEPDLNLNKAGEEFHNHFTRFAAGPLSYDGKIEGPAQRMAWQRRRGDVIIDSDRIDIDLGEFYAIDDHVNVLHSVETISRHFTVVAAEIPLEEVKLGRLPARCDPLDDKRTKELIAEIKAAAILTKESIWREMEARFNISRHAPLDELIFPAST